MTNLQEAKLAREAEICYSTLALATDYDCWHDVDVTVEQVMQIMASNIEKSKAAISAAVPKIKAERDCACATALEHGIITNHKLIPKKTKKDLNLIIGKYVK